MNCQKPEKTTFEKMPFNVHCDWLAEQMDKYNNWYEAKKKRLGKKVDWVKCRKARTAYFKGEIIKNIFSAEQLYQEKRGLNE